MYMYMAVNTHVPFAGLHRSAQGVQPCGTSNAHFKPIASKGNASGYHSLKKKKSKILPIFMQGLYRGTLDLWE